MLLHLVRAAELLAADRTRKDLALRALVVEEGVALKAVLVLETLADLGLLALQAAITAVLRDLGVAQQVQAAHRHVGQSLGVEAGLGGQVAARARRWAATAAAAAARQRRAGAVAAASGFLLTWGRWRQRGGR